jgi:hypothetical protein
MMCLQATNAMKAMQATKAMKAMKAMKAKMKAWHGCHDEFASAGLQLCERWFPEPFGAAMQRCFAEFSLQNETLQQ